MQEFRNLGIEEAVLKSIEESHYEKPTEIQAKAIPAILAGQDVIAESSTGSGKTLAFGTGIIKTVIRGNGIQSLVLVPTRELAEQVSRELIKFSRHKQLRVAPVYGGVSINPQIDAMRRGSEVIVGTPGRILDHLRRGTLALHKIKILVLDEADRMFDMGFIDDIRQIISQCPTERQTVLCSATITTELAHLVHRYMRDPVRVAGEKAVDPRKLTQVYYDVDDKMKFSLLVHLIKSEQTGLVMVFCNTRRNTDFVYKNLKQLGIEAMAIHGGFSQNKRSNTLERFHDSKVYVLVCTDVASRGLDIKGVSHVYNYDIPKDSKEYVHRIGRTARAGAEGKAICVLSKRDHDNFRRVMRDNDVHIEKQELPQFERVVIQWKGGELDENETGQHGGFRRGGFGRGGGRGGFGGQRRGPPGAGGYGRGGYGGGQNRGFGGQRRGPPGSGGPRYGSGGHSQGHSDGQSHNSQ